ncbi:MAG: RNA-binding S4 domain-containing protein [Firmicutes bacterium]|nr:RNA-binding S4 domain-containing protein [Bacillota bacterium]
MRLDKFLKVSRVLKRRTVAAEACDKGKVCVNDKPAKPAKQLAVGDIVSVSFGTTTMRFVVKALTTTTKKEDADKMYEICT